MGGQILISPALMQAAGRGFVLGEEVEVHAKGIREALLCRELLGHEEHPELELGEGETIFTTLAEPLSLSYVRLTDKHLNEQMEHAAMVSLSHRRAVIETRGPLARHTNLMLRLETEMDQEEAPELYAKVIRPLDESRYLYIVHFTSASPTVQTWICLVRAKAGIGGG